MRRNRSAVAVVSLSLVIGVGLITGAVVIPNPHITAVRVDATVEPSPAGTTCASHGAVELSFPWQNSRVTGEQLLAHECDTYRVGDHAVLFVASNDPTGIETQPSAILDPSTVDPFDFIGPNGLNGFLGFLGSVSLIGGTALFLTKGRRHSSSQREFQHGVLGGRQP